MAIQTDVKLQPDYYMLSVCDGGKFPHCRNVHKEAALVVTANYNTSVSGKFLCSVLGLPVSIVPFVLAVARSKLGQRQYFLTQFTDMLFCYCYKCFFFNIGPTH